MVLIKIHRAFNVWLRPAAAAACLLLLFLYANSATAVRAAQGQNAETPAVAQVLSNVRKAIGYNKLKKLKRGFVLEEVDVRPNEKESNVKVLTFGAFGEFREDSIPRSERPFGFDGRFGWQLDRSGFPTPVAKRLREKLLLPAWIRGGWWLDVNTTLAFSVLPTETNEKQVTLSMKQDGGLVGAKILIDRGTWLPTTLIVEYERGPYTLTFDDYQETLGIQFPQRTSFNYRGSDSEFKLKSITETPKTIQSPFETPSLPDDSTFDNSRSAELKVTQGVPFSASAPGHFYVRPLIDGKVVGWFHFDSGGDTTQIDVKIADELQMPILGKSQTMGADGKVQEVTIRQGKTFQLGRITYKNPIYIVSDMTGKNAPPGEKRAGLIGYPLFARAVVEVTGGGKQIALYEPKTYKLGRGKWQELFYIDLTPAVEARLEGNRRGLFQLDTGFTGTVTFYDRFIKDEKLVENRETRDATDTGSGGSYRLLTGKLDWFELAGYKFDKPEVGFRVSGFSREGGAGVVGREFLSVFTVVFNYPERRIAFIR